MICRRYNLRYAGGHFNFYKVGRGGMVSELKCDQNIVYNKRTCKIVFTHSTMTVPHFESE